MVKFTTPNLTVQKAQWDEAHSDIIRINIDHRGDFEKGRVCKITVNGKSEYVILRGTDEKNIITLDYDLRQRLLLKPNDSERFVLTRGFWLCDEIKWAWSASDASYRIAARLGVVSFFLGAVSLVIAIAPIICAYFKK